MKIGDEVRHTSETYGIFIVHQLLPKSRGAQLVEVKHFAFSPDDIVYRLRTFRKVDLKLKATTK